MRALLLIGLLLATFVACKKEVLESTGKWGFYTPEGWPAAVYDFEGNALSYERFALGRDIFFDPILSSDSTVSCASCHAQVHAFADHNNAFSKGVNGLLGNRNSPTLVNMAWNPSFMWDGGVNHIEVFSVAPITNPVEMNESMGNVVAKLNAHKRYKERFQKAYNVKEVNDQVLLKALAQYMALIVSNDSKYDRYVRGTASFSAEEKAGLNLFRQHCTACHQEPLFTDYSFRNNGLDEVFTDLGRGLITQDPTDNGKFKVPTLRNVALTYPYMHDGRFYTLEQVLLHYATGIQSSATLDPLLINGIALTSQERAQLIAFLKTLTDYSLLENKFLQEQKQ